MKRTIFAATVAVQILAFPTISFAAADAVAAAQPLDAKTEALLQQCLNSNLLLPEQVQTMTDPELNAALVDCAATLQAQAAAAPAPIVRRLPIVQDDTPTVVHRRQRFVAADEPEFVGGGGGGFGGGDVATPITINSNSNNTTNSGNGDGNVFGNGNASGGNGGIGVGGGGGIGNGGGGNAGGGAGGGNGGGGAAGGGGGAGANNVKLNNIQKDALIGNGLKSGESKASTVSKDIGSGLKSVTDTRVSKLPNGNVRVTQSTRVINGAGQVVGAPNTKSQSFTPDDVAVLKQTHGNAPLDNIPTFAKKGTTFAGLKNGQTGAAGSDRFAAMRARLAGKKDGTTGIAADKTGTAAGNSRFAALREKLAAKNGKLDAAGTTTGTHSRFAEMRAKMAAAKAGKTGVAAGTKGTPHNRFAEAMKRRQLQTAQGKTGSGVGSSVGKIAKRSDRGIIQNTRQAKSNGTQARSTNVRNASKIFARHNGSSKVAKVAKPARAAKVAKSSGGKGHGGLRRFASR